MLQRYYYRTLLAVLPSVESHLRAFANRVEKLDQFTNRVERAIEEEAVKLANDAQDRRSAIIEINKAYDRKAGHSMTFIGTVRKDLEKAAEVRDSVADFLERLVG